MKILVGVDVGESYRSSMELCKKLKFSAPEWLLASTVPLPYVYPAEAYLGVSPGNEARRYLVTAARTELDQAASLADNGRARDFLVDGEAAPALIQLADEHMVDLIVVGSGQTKGGLLWRIGSVSRTLTYGAKQSLLVAKQPLNLEKPIHAVFATDHSAYAARAAQQLISWAPKGIGRLDIVTAYDLRPKEIRNLVDITEVEVDFEKWMREEALEKGNQLAEAFRKIVPEVNVRVMKGEVNEVLHRSMKLSGADLLIVGAQGHGFMERLLIGSVSLHQVVAELYPVLVIRVPS